MAGKKRGTARRATFRGAGRPAGSARYLLGGLLGSAALPVLAQVAPPSAGTDNVTLQEVVVTATKRSASANDVAVSLSALTSEDLAKEGFRSFSDFATSVPGMDLAERGPGASQISLRGVVSDPGNGFTGDNMIFNETVGVYLDEAPISWNSFNPEPRLFDTNRVEILRGPQGTLFGAGSMAGAMRYISNSPDPTRFEAKASIDLNQNERHGKGNEIDGMINIPLFDGASALRIAAYRADVPGYIDNMAPVVDPRDPNYGAGPIRNVNDQESYGARIQFSWESGAFKAVARHYFEHITMGGGFSEDTYQTFPGGVTLGNNPADALLGRYQQSRLPSEAQWMRYSIPSLEMSYDFSRAQLVSVTSYMDAKRYTPTDITDFVSVIFRPPETPVTSCCSHGGLYINAQTNSAFSQEIRMVSTGDGPIDWLGGVFYQYIDRRSAGTNPNPGLSEALGLPPGVTTCSLFGIADEICAEDPDSILGSYYQLKQNQLAFFGEFGWQFAPHWKLVAGARWFKMDSELGNYRPSTGPFGAGGSSSNRLSEDGTNPKVSLEFRPTKTALLYLTAEKGFRLGGANSVQLPPLCENDPNLPPGGSDISNVAKSDWLWNYEIGSKVTLQDRVQLNMAAYYEDWENIPIQVQLTCGFQLVTNGLRAKIRGAEVEATVAATRNLSFSANLSYTDSKYPRAQPILGIPAGSELPLTSKVTWGLSGNYTFPVYEQAQGYLSASYRHRGDSYNLSDTRVRQILEGYGTANLRIGVTNGAWDGSIYVRNLTNVYATTYKDTLILLHNRDSIVRPRTYGLNVTYKY